MHPESLPCATSKRGTAARLSAGLGWRLQVLDCTVGPLALVDRSQTPGFSARPATHQPKHRTIQSSRRARELHAVPLLIIIAHPTQLPCRGDKCITCRVCRCIDSSLPFSSPSIQHRSFRTYINELATNERHIRRGLELIRPSSQKPCQNRDLLLPSETSDRCSRTRLLPTTSTTPTHVAALQTHA